ncbi:MAG: cystathionine beta-lyase [Gammaproteobacteria bacterium]|nr:MAG: cystathionine beta-lyase [Gammaproteobacteria bacterium]
MSNDKQLHFDSKVIHAGQSPDPATGAVMQPIYATSTYVQSSPGVHQGYEYGRSENPTRMAFERSIAALESGSLGLAFSSGLAAISAVLDHLEVGSHVLAMDDLYGGTFRLFNRIKARTSNLAFSHVDMSDMSAIEAAIRPETRMIWVETPSNPLLRIADLRGIVAVAKKHNLITVVDNTFATPYNQRPLELGFDVVMHSTTKYVNGHSDIIGGALVVGDNEELQESLKFLQFAVGAIAGPFDSFLVLRGIKTLALRMQRHNQSGLAIAKWLEQHPDVDQVIYPGLESHPQYELAASQMSGFSGMISLFIQGDLARCRRFLEALKLFTLAESLGGVESLVNHPAIMTHASLPAEKREELGIADNFVRLSVGIESEADLINDLEQAFAIG